MMRLAAVFVLCWMAIAWPAVMAQDTQRPLDLLLKQPRAPDFTVHVTGWQYGWSYEYSIGTVGGPEAQQVCSTTEVVVPQGKSVVLVLTSVDVIHQWTMPLLGHQADAIPGLLTVLELDTSKPGTFAGGATEMSGPGYATMTVKLRVVSESVFGAWLKLKTKPGRCKTS